MHERIITVSVCEKVIASACEKAIASAHEKASHLWLNLVGLGGSTQGGSTVNIHMENSKDLTYFYCMLVLKLFTLLFTIHTERINSPMHEKVIASECGKAIVCT